MKFAIKLFPEIIVKSRPVRKRFIKMLEGNIRSVLKRIDEGIKIRALWDKIEVESPTHASSELNEQLFQAMCKIPGVDWVLEIRQFQFENMDDIYQPAQTIYGHQLKNKTFCVRVRRVGEHAFSSLDIERYVGGGLNQNSESLGVRLKNPDLEIRLEVEQNTVSMITRQQRGLGGFPIATQESVLSLLSGGFDSAVSSFRFINRGCRVHYCFFNLGGDAHESGVREMAYHLWNNFGSSHRVKFVAIPFGEVVSDILANVDNGLMGVVLKRMMMRAADKVAEKLNIEALVTGEAVGQVSSQTVTNLNVIDKAIDRVILRPLIVSDKQDIIDVAHQIGTYDLAASMPEYCGVISNNPTVKAKLSKVEAEEAKLNMALLDEVVFQAKVEDIRDVLSEKPIEHAVDIVAQLPIQAHIIDVRSDVEVEQKPLELDDVFVTHIPFFKLASKFSQLPEQTTYYLYCDRGVMSRLQAIHLKEAGHQNVKVYRP